MPCILLVEIEPQYRIIQVHTYVKPLEKITIKFSNYHDTHFHMKMKLYMLNSDNLNNSFVFQTIHFHQSTA